MKTGKKMKTRVLIPIAIIAVIVIYGYGIRIAEPSPVPVNESGMGEMRPIKMTVWELDDTHKVWLHSHGFSIIKLDQTNMPPEFAQFEMTAHFAGILPYRISLECPEIKVENIDSQPSDRNCLEVLLS